MGYTRHHAIIVTSWSDADIQRARTQAVEIFGETVSEILTSPINVYLSFFISPDGSNEGWDDSDEGDQRRDRFIAWIQAQRNEFDGGPRRALDWAEVQYGDDHGETIICRDSDEWKREAEQT